MANSTLIQRAIKQTIEGDTLVTVFDLNAIVEEMSKQIPLKDVTYQLNGSNLVIRATIDAEKILRRANIT